MKNKIKDIIIGIAVIGGLLLLGCIASIGDMQEYTEAEYSRVTRLPK